MAKKKSTSKSYTMGNPFSLKESCTQLYILALCLFLPIFIPNGYYNLGEYKNYFFLYSTYAYIALWIVALMIEMVVARKSIHEKKAKNTISSDDLSMSTGFAKFRDLVTPIDAFAALFLLCALVSCMLSQYGKYAWTGYPGWDDGLRLQFLLFAVFVFVSICLSKRVIAVWSLGTVLVLTSLVTLLQRFGFNPFGFYTGLTADEMKRFVGTMGQASWYSSFLAVAIPFMIGIYVYQNELPKESTLKLSQCASFSEVLMILSYNKTGTVLLKVVLCIASAAAVVQNSDSIYISFALTFAALILFADSAKMKRIIDALIMSFASFKAIGLLQIIMSKHILVELDKLSLFMSKSLVTWIGLAALVLIRVWMMRGQNNEKKGILLRKILIALMIASVFVIIVLLIVNNVTEGGGMGYFHFDETWGSTRGFIWSLAWKAWRESSALNKIFGVGPGCMGFYVDGHYEAEISHIFGQEYTLANAHNEWLTMLINVGIVGALTYLGWFVSAIVMGVRNRKQTPYAPILTVCIISYMGHNMFGYQQIMSVPYIVLALAGISRISRGAKTPE